DVRRRTVLRVHRVLLSRSQAPDQSVRLHVLRAHRIPRDARDGRSDLAVDAVHDGAARAAAPVAGARRRDRRTVLALRGRGLDRDLHPGVSDPVGESMDEREESAPQPAEHAHPGAKEYLGIAVILTVITAIEVAVYYVPAMRPMLVPTLLVLS